MLTQTKQQYLTT